MTNDKAAELLAAVRAVESGERSAASFFTETAPAPARRSAPPSARTGGERGAPAPHAPGGPSAAGGGGSGPVTVPSTVPELLAEGGAPETLARPVVEALGEGAAELLREDPWQLLAVAGVRPEQADGFARALLGEESRPEDERRAEALVVWLLERAALAGHTVLEPAALAKGLSQHGVPDADEAVRGAIESGAVLVFEDALDAGPRIDSSPSSGAADGDEGDGEEQEHPVRVLVGLDRFALAEESLADGLARLISTFVPPREESDGAAEAGEGTEATHGSVEAADATGNEDAQTGGYAQAAAPGGTATRADWAGAASAAPSPSAAELIRAVAAHGLVAHTGGEAARAEPAALVAAARGMGLRACVAAHTDDGRTRLAAALAGPAGPTGEESPTGPEGAEGPGDTGDTGEVTTVVGLLGGREGPARDEDGAWALDLLVVCDAPQLDAETAAALVESLPDGARLVLSGDPLLLGSAGPGQVFGDLLAARCCPQVASRTPDPGPVGELVSGIGIGELNTVEAPGKEVVIVPVQDAGEAVHRAVQLLADSVPRAIGIPAERTQVITPGHGGAAGTRALNTALKERLNPGPGRFGGFDPGDRVAHSPAPGRTTLGSVTSADEAGLHLDCAGRPVVVPREQVAGSVRHGWALTAHQAAGTRWPAAVVVLPGDATGALSRQWVYTAFGRAARHLSVVHGAGDALPGAVAGPPPAERVTRLRTLLAQSQAVRAAEAAGAAGAAAAAGGAGAA